MCSWNPLRNATIQICQTCHWCNCNYFRGKVKFHFYVLEREHFLAQESDAIQKTYLFVHPPKMCVVGVVKVGFRLRITDRLLLSLSRAKLPCRAPSDSHVVCSQITVALFPLCHCDAMAFCRATNLFLICWVHFLTPTIDHKVSAVPSLTPLKSGCSSDMLSVTKPVTVLYQFLEGITFTWSFGDESFKESLAAMIL